MGIDDPPPPPPPDDQKERAATDAEIARGRPGLERPAATETLDTGNRPVPVVTVLATDAELIRTRPGPETTVATVKTLESVGADPWDETAQGPPDPWKSRPKEHDLGSRDFVDQQLLAEDPHANIAFKLSTADGVAAVYKPAEGECPGLRDSIPDGTMWQREVAAYRVDHSLGYDLVPTTIAYEGEQGFGSLQDWAPLVGLDHDEYSDLDQQRMAVFDYIVGNTDRHDSNFLTQNNGCPAAIDNGLCFPVSCSEPIRSSFVADHLGKPLSEEVLRPVRDLDMDQIRGVLAEVKIEDRAIDGACARIREVQSGAITSESWPGDITDADWNIAGNTPHPSRMQL